MSSPSLASNQLASCFKSEDTVFFDVLKQTYGSRSVPESTTQLAASSVPVSSEPSSETLPTVSSSSHGPSHYRRGKIQTWDFIRDQDLNFHLGNAIKYICRAGHKDSKVDDLKKAIHYLQNELEHNS